MSPPGIAAAASFFGSSATMASVVISRPATEAASCRARTDNLGRVNDTSFDHVDEFFGLGVEAEVCRVFLDLADNDGAFDTSVFAI
jgi:hypothetical protein